MRDRINILYADLPLKLSSDFEVLSEYADFVRNACMASLEEEAVLVAAYLVYHAA